MNIESTGKATEEVTQVYKLWKTFLERLEGRGLAFADVALRESKSDTLLELCFTSTEIQVLSSEWGVTSEVLREHSGGAKSDLPSVATLMDWEAGLGASFEAVEEFMTMISKSLHCLDDALYRIKLSAEYLADLCKREMNNASKFPLMHRISARSAELCDACSHKIQTVKDAKARVSTDVLPWLLASLRSIRTTIASLEIAARGSLCYIVTPDVLYPLKQINKINTFLPAVRIPVIPPPGDVKDFLDHDIAYKTIAHERPVPGLTAFGDVQQGVSVRLPPQQNSPNIDLLAILSRENVASVITLNSPAGSDSSGESHPIQDDTYTVPLVVAGFVIAACSIPDSLTIDKILTLASGEYHYDEILIKTGGVLKCSVRDSESSTGGYLKLVATKLTVEEGGSIDLTGCGYKGGTLLRGIEAQQGDSPVGEGSMEISCNGPGGGGGRADPKKGSSGGGGGGAATDGANGRPVGGGIGGLRVIRKPDEMSIGAGGGGGHPFTTCFSDSDGSDTGEVTTPPGTPLEDPSSSCIPGGAGGGYLEITANSLSNYGAILANGEDGSDGPTFGTSGGGGGAGGTVQIITAKYNNHGIVQAKGGIGGSTPSFKYKFSYSPRMQHKTTVGSGGSGADGWVQVTSNLK